MRSYNFRRIGISPDEALALAEGIRESMRDGFVVVGADGSVLLANERFAEMFSLDGVPAGSSAADTFARIASLLVAPEPDLDAGDAADVELVDGRVYVRHASTLRLADGTVRGHVVSYRDVTEQRRLATERLLSAERIISLVSGIAHEINNPLAIASGNVELVQSNIRDAAALVDRLDDGGMVEALGEARAALERIETIVRDLRTLARVDDATRTPLDLHAVVERAVKAAASRLAPGARLVTELGRVPVVFANEGRLVQVVFALVENAAHAVGSGGRITVRTATTPRGWAAVEVIDTGSGIAKEHVARVFDPFFTTKRVGAGAGLGLAVAKGIVEAAGGAVRIAATSPAGTTFVVELPPAG